MPLHPKVVTYKNFNGLNNNQNPENTPVNYLKKALNVNIDKTGNVSKRKGYTKVITGSFTSLWASPSGNGCYAVLEGNLIKINYDYTYSTLLNNVGIDKLSFEEVDNIIYFSSVSYNGIIENGTLKTWGLSKNLIKPILSVTTGSLLEGIYQVSFTYVRNDGIESGVSESTKITIPINSGITLNIPSINDSSILYARIYCSTQNGSTLYYSGTSTIGSNYTINTISNLSNPLRLFNLDAAPTGHIVRYYRGRIYIASDNILWYSEPLQYQHFRLNSNYIEFPTRIKEIMPVEDGIWIGSDRLYFLSGDEPTQFKRIIKDNIKIVEGTATIVSSSYNLEGTDQGSNAGSPAEYKWLVTSNIGILSLNNSNQSSNLTVQNVELEQSLLGTSLFLQEAGRNQYLSILKTNNTPNNSVVGDLVETSIVRNERVFHDAFGIGDAIVVVQRRNGIIIP